MGLLYERDENKDKIIFRFRFYALRIVLLLYFLVAIVAAALLRDVLCTTLLAIPTLLLAVFYYYEYGIPLKEISKARREGRVDKSGSKFLPSKPLTFEIKKIPSPPPSANNIH